MRDYCRQVVNVDVVRIGRRGLVGRRVIRIVDRDLFRMGVSFLVNGPINVGDVIIRRAGEQALHVGKVYG